MKNKVKKVVLTTGLLSLMLLGGPIVQNNPLGAYMGSMTTYAAEQTQTYSDNWQMDSAGTWWYYLNDGSLVKDAWVQDYGEWYLLGSDGAMRTGVFQSNEGKYYLLDTVRGTGTYGKLLKNGSVYQGVTLVCDTSAAYEGALSSETIAALQAAGVSFAGVPNVTNTKHVSNGVVTSDPQSEQTTNNGGSNNYGQDGVWDYLAEDGDYDGMPAQTARQIRYDFNGDGKLTGGEYQVYLSGKTVIGQTDERVNIH